MLFGRRKNKKKPVLEKCFFFNIYFFSSFLLPLSLFFFLLIILFFFSFYFTPTRFDAIRSTYANEMPYANEAIDVASERQSSFLFYLLFCFFLPSRTRFFLVLMAFLLASYWIPIEFYCRREEEKKIIIEKFSHYHTVSRLNESIECNRRVKKKGWRSSSSSSTSSSSLFLFFSTIFIGRSSFSEINSNDP